jgi:WD40 repeat protein
MLLQLPEEVAIMIFLHLTFYDVLRLVTVCKRLKRVCSDDILWKKFFETRYFSLEVNPETLQKHKTKGWKYLYFNRSIIENAMWTSHITPVTVFETSLLEITCMEYDDTYVVTGGGISEVWDFDPSAIMAPKTVQLHSILNGKKLKTLHGHTDSISCLKFYKDTIISGSKDMTIKVWTSEKSRWSKHSPYKVQTLIGHKKVICSLAWKPESVLISGAKDHLVKVWQPRSGQCLHTLDLKSAVFAVDYSGNTLVAGGKDKKLNVFDMETMQPKITFEGHNGWVTCVQMASNRIISAGADGRVRVWDLRTNEICRDFRIHKNMFSFGCITALASDDNKIVTGGTNKLVKVTDFVTGKCIHSLKAHMDAITGLQFDSEKIVSSSLDHSVKLWDFARTGKYEHQFRCRRERRNCTVS